MRAPPVPAECVRCREPVVVGEVVFPVRRVTATDGTVPGEVEIVDVKRVGYVHVICPTAESTRQLRIDVNNLELIIQALIERIETLEARS